MKTIQEIARSLSGAKWLMILAGILIVLLLGTCTVNRVMDSMGHRQVVKEQNRDISARNNADEQRVKDQTEIQANTEKLNEIVENTPASVPSDQRYALACARMRADSRVKQLPARCGSGPQGETAVRP